MSGKTANNHTDRSHPRNQGIPRPSMDEAEGAEEVGKTVLYNA